MRRQDLVVGPPPWSDAREHDDVAVTLLPEQWTANALERAVSQTPSLVKSLAVVARCGKRELRLLRGPSTERLDRRLTPAVDLVVTALSGPSRPGGHQPCLTLTNLPDGHLLFDELATGRKIVVAELADARLETMHQWLRLLRTVADQVGEDPVARGAGRCLRYGQAGVGDR